MAEKYPFFLREWRKHRGMTQAKLAEATGMATGYVAELESRKRRYNEDVLETLALALGCKPADLLMRNPETEDPIASIWENVPATERSHAIAVLKTFAKKAG